MDEARQVALAMGEENWQRGTALGLVAASQAELGLVDAALETARSIGDEIERIQEISDVARIAITKGNDDEARAAFEEAVEVASDLEFFEDQLDGLYWIARNQTHAGEINGAIEIAGNMVKEGQAKGAIPLLKANRESARVLAEVAMQLFRTDPHQARKHVEEALALACEEQTAKPSLSLAGTYTAQGSNPDGSQYSGTCEITAMGADEYQFQWAVGGNYTGTGTLNGDTITVDWGSDAPVIYKVQADRSLVGTWANGRATEILKRQ